MSTLDFESKRQTPETAQTPETPQTLKGIIFLLLKEVKTGGIGNYVNEIKARLESALKGKEIPLAKFKTFCDEDKDGNPILTTYDGRVLLKSEEGEEKILEITRETDVLISVKIKSEGKEYYDIYTRNGLYLEKKGRYNEKGGIGNTIVCKIGKINEEFKYSDYQQEICDIRNGIHEKLWEKVKNLNSFETIKDLCLYKTKDDNGMRILRGLHYNGELEELIKIDGKEGDDIEIKEIGKNLLVIKNGKESKLLKIRGKDSNVEIPAEGKKIRRLIYEDRNYNKHLLDLIIVEKIDGNFDVYERKNHKLNPIVTGSETIQEGGKVWEDNKIVLIVNNGKDFIYCGEYRRRTEILAENNNLLVLSYKVNNKVYNYLMKKSNREFLLETKGELELLTENIVSEKTKGGYILYKFERGEENRKENGDNNKLKGLYKLGEFAEIETEETEETGEGIKIKCYDKKGRELTFTDQSIPSGKNHVTQKKIKYNPYTFK